jgi:hypothetical protein
VEGPAAVFDPYVDPDQGGPMPVPGMGRWQAGMGGGSLCVLLVALDLLTSKAQHLASGG